MRYISLSIIASILVIIGYIPEIKNIIKTKSATIDNLYIWLIWSTGSIFSITFCFLNEEYYAMSTHVIIFTMNSTTLLIKFYYYKKSLNKNNSLFIQDTDIETNTIINPLQIV
jgi:hypothetical protein